MTPEKVKAVLDTYAEVLKGMGAEPVRDEHPSNLIDYHSAAGKNHLLWMCGEAKSIVDAGKSEKAMRWLGFLQGAFWGLRIRTLEDMKRDNMPPEEEFQAARV